MRLEEFTKPQQAAITQRGSIIVSAAAGSGKTAVLVQRIIDRLTGKERLSADRLLVVTFTVAAAGEMRSRIQKGIDDYLSEHPEDKYVAKQKLLLQSAKICTIDSYCIDMVRENFSKAGVSPDFKIAEDKDILLISEKTMSEVFEKYFESENEAFIKLLDAFGSFYDDSAVKKAVMDIYEKSQNMPFPRIWLEAMKHRYSDEAFEGWCFFAYNEALRRIRIVQRYMNVAFDCINAEEELIQKYAASFYDAKEQIDIIEKAALNEDWNNLYFLCNSFVFGNLRSVSDAQNKNAVMAKAVKGFCVAQINKLKDIFSEDSENTIKMFLENSSAIEMLLTLAIEYTEEVEKQKREQNFYTFSDIEHLAFSLICENKNGIPTLKEEAKEYINNYDEVLVDEYQDVNNLQDVFFYFLSDFGKHLFVVGDVKQSIYGFRGSNPSNFIEKTEKAVGYETADENDLKSIQLDANFRSRKGICECVNFMFDRLMTKENCGISYIDERLDAQGSFPESSEVCAELHLVNAAGNNEKEAEAIHIADCIENIMSSGEIITDKERKALRKAKYSDFAVIMRVVDKNASIVAEELKRRGIPVSYTKESFIETREIGIMLSLLRVLDNPTREVELLSTMMSPMFGFTPDDMADIRCESKKTGLYSAVLNSAVNGNDKCKSFIDYIGDLRRSAVVLPLNKLIMKIYDTTGFLSIAEMMSDGQARRANLIRLSELATSFGATGNNNIGSFLNYLGKLSENKLKGATVSAGSDSVKIMSIHNSKGLQFPVCIVAFSGTPFSTSDQKNSLIIDADYGVAFRAFDEEMGKVMAIDRKLLNIISKRNTLKEELRMLYVAATRAQDKLVITMAKKNPENALTKAGVNLTAAGGKISEDIYSLANGFGDWILSCMLIHPDGGRLREAAGVSFLDYEKTEPMNIDIYNVVKKEETDVMASVMEVDNDIVTAIRERISATYSFEELRSIEAKASVSDIANKAEIGAYDFTSRPGFLNKSGLTPTGRGTAVHKIMQFMDFKAARESFDQEIERLKEWEFITEEEAKVDTVHIRRFVRSELFDRIYSSKKVEREMQFLTYMPAGLIKSGLPEKLKYEKIVVQGAVDLLFYEDDGIVIVDFKTDRVSDRKKLIDAYGEQLSIYSDACEKITGLPVKEKIIYSLVLDSSIVL